MKPLKIFIALLLAFNLQAQNSICPDVEGAVEHRLITKYKNSCIIGYNEIKFDAVSFPTEKITIKGTEKTYTAEGKVINDYFIYFDNRLQHFYIHTPQERFDLMNSIFPDIHNKVPQHMIASYINITPVHLSRLKKQTNKKI